MPSLGEAHGKTREQVQPRRWFVNAITSDAEAIEDQLLTSIKIQRRELEGAHPRSGATKGEVLQAIGKNSTAHKLSRRKTGIRHRCLATEEPPSSRFFTLMKKWMSRPCLPVKILQENGSGFSQGRPVGAAGSNVLLYGHSSYRAG